VKPIERSVSPLIDTGYIEACGFLLSSKLPLYCPPSSDNRQRGKVGETGRCSAGKLPRFGAAYGQMWISTRCQCLLLGKGQLLRYMDALREPFSASSCRGMHANVHRFRSASNQEPRYYPRFSGLRCPHHLQLSGKCISSSAPGNIR
jgi:hypothetical protein